MKNKVNSWKYLGEFSSYFRLIQDNSAKKKMDVVLKKKLFFMLHCEQETLFMVLI